MSKVTVEPVFNWEVESDNWEVGDLIYSTEFGCAVGVFRGFNEEADLIIENIYGGDVDGCWVESSANNGLTNIKPSVISTPEQVEDKKRNNAINDIYSIIMDAEIDAMECAKAVYDAGYRK